jgi:ABC-type transport system involved in multi-copper enzyme maturation permease subunit
VPALIGAFAGAPVLARELETGTFRYAWTQGFGRWRWALAKLVPLAVALTAAAGAIGVLLSWYYGPYFTTANMFLAEESPLANMFVLRGITFAAWTMAAFALGALAGMVIRRVVPAIAATLAVYLGLAFAAGLYLRPHYLTPVTARNLFNPPVSAWNRQSAVDQGRHDDQPVHDEPDHDRHVLPADARSAPFRRQGFRR